MLEIKNLEVRIKIKKGFVRISLLPNYDSVVEAFYPKWINPDTSYRFFMGGLKRKTKMVITKLETVCEFNDKM